jgi:hypothetical protein
MRRISAKGSKPIRGKSESAMISPSLHVQPGVFTLTHVPPQPNGFLCQGIGDQWLTLKGVLVPPYKREFSPADPGHRARKDEMRCYARPMRRVPPQEFERAHPG